MREEGRGRENLREGQRNPEREGEEREEEESEHVPKCASVINLETVAKYFITSISPPPFSPAFLSLLGLN